MMERILHVAQELCIDTIIAVFLYAATVMWSTYRGHARVDSNRKE